jgi:hypothetical protein
MNRLLPILMLVAITAVSACTSGSGAPSTPTPAKIAGAQLLDCAASMGGQGRPGVNSPELVNAIALDTSEILQANASGQGDPRYAYFAKSALFVRPGRAFEIIVPDRWVSRVGVAWGNGPASVTSHLQAFSCAARDNAEWLAYPGGFYIAEPACVPLTIKAGSNTRTVHVAVGAPCTSTNTS